MKVSNHSVFFFSIIFLIFGGMYATIRAPAMTGILIRVTAIVFVLSSISVLVLRWSQFGYLHRIVFGFLVVLNFLVILVAIDAMPGGVF